MPNCDGLFCLCHGVGRLRLLLQCSWFLLYYKACVSCNNKCFGILYEAWFIVHTQITKAVCEQAIRDLHRRSETCLSVKSLAYSVWMWSFYWMCLQLDPEVLICWLLSDVRLLARLNQISNMDHGLTTEVHTSFIAHGQSQTRLLWTVVLLESDRSCDDILQALRGRSRKFTLKVADVSASS